MPCHDVRLSASSRSPFREDAEQGVAVVERARVARFARIGFIRSQLNASTLDGRKRSLLDDKDLSIYTQMPQSPGSRANTVFRLAQIVWVAVLAALLLRWWLTEEPPRWFELLLPVSMVGLSFSIMRRRNVSARTVPYLVLASGALFLAVRVRELLVR
jgi:hypothetical protein